MIQYLEKEKFITSKEANSINPYQILQFTKSKIWGDLQNAKEYYKEQPFYINVPAKELEETNADENILDASGNIVIEEINAIMYDPFNHGYYKVGEKVGQAFSDGNKLK